jgi:hypothetical protein
MRVAAFVTDVVCCVARQLGRPKRRLAFASLFALVWPLQIDASGQDRSVQSFATRTDIITVDVVVLDKAGRPVRGLREGDFTVREDGRPQEIVAFEARDLKASSPPARPPAGVVAQREAREPTPDRALALVVDDLSGHQCVNGVAAIRRWIEEKADSRDRVSFFTTSGRGASLSREPSTWPTRPAAPSCATTTWPGPWPGRSTKRKPTTSWATFRDDRPTGSGGGSRSRSPGRG